jgi:hypothetical protein
LDFDTCDKCVNGYSVNANGGCSEAKSFVNVIPQSPKLLSQITLSKSRPSEIVNFNNNLKGTGIGSNTVSFTFFIRRITQYDIDTNIFQTTSNLPAENVRFYIHGDHCYLQIGAESHRVGNCSYVNLYNWNYFQVILNKNGNEAQVQVQSGTSTPTIAPTTEFKTPIPVTINWLNRNSNIEFNHNGRGNAYELQNFNVYDYPLNKNDTTAISDSCPQFCDYSCLDCRGTCQRCPGDIAPVNGFCPAVYVPVANDLQILTNKPSVSLRDRVTHRLDSYRYAFVTWFYSVKPQNQEYTIGRLGYPYQPSTPIIAARVVSGHLQVQVNKQVFDYPSRKVKNNKWYQIAVTVSETGEVHVILHSRNGKQFVAVQQLNTPTRLLTEDAQFSVLAKGGVANFQGSYYDGRVYVNNIPAVNAIDDHHGKLRCPKNCKVCNQSMRCARCANGFQLNKDFQCVDADLGSHIVGLDKYSFFNNETYTLHVPNAFFEKPFALSFWYRKKIHSVPNQPIPQPFFTVLSYVPASNPNELFPLVTEHLQPDCSYNSNFTIGGDCGPSKQFVENFSNEVYSWIHFVLNFYPKQKVVTFNVQNDNNVHFVGNYTYNATKFIFGDPKGADMNFEIGNAFFYSKPISASNLPKVQATEPKDCDPSCKVCNYMTGLCQE